MVRNDDNSPSLSTRSTCSRKPNMKYTCKVDIIYAQDASRQMEGVRQLLATNQLALDPGVELFVICRHQDRVIACAGLDNKTIKCVAIDENFGGDSLDVTLAREVRRLATEHRAFPLFIYSAPHALEFFRAWGFYPIVEAPQLVVLMENSPIAIKAYCDKLR